MFDKLKLKLIAINMVMLIAVFIAIFGSIFLITSNNIKRDGEIHLFFYSSHPLAPATAVVRKIAPPAIFFSK